jgi:hypothetical protein
MGIVQRELDAGNTGQEQGDSRIFNDRIHVRLNGEAYPGRAGDCGVLLERFDAELPAAPDFPRLHDARLERDAVRLAPFGDLDDAAEEPGIRFPAPAIRIVRLEWQEREQIAHPHPLAPQPFLQASPLPPGRIGAVDSEVSEADVDVLETERAQDPNRGIEGEAGERPGGAGDRERSVRYSQTHVVIP